MGPDPGRYRNLRAFLALATSLGLGAVPAGGIAPPAGQASRSEFTASSWAIRSGSLAAPGSPSGDPLATRVASARAAADATARRVDALRVEYLQRTTHAATAARRLADAFAAQSRVDGQHEADTAALAQAQASWAASVRAVYADGGRLGLWGSVLSADSPDDALWRLGTARRIQAQVLRDGQRQAAEAASLAAQSQQASQDTARTGAELSRALATLRDDVAAADEALRRARAELARLSADARRLAVAQEAARKLAAAAAAAARLAGPATVTALPIPADYETAYRAAARTCPGMDWTLLAAVGQIESGHGRNNGPSSAGAIGPMQFMPATFARYAVDGNGDKFTDPWDFHDAIATAAAYLCASGARGGTPEGIRAALFAYNHAQWYVDLVLAAQRAILHRAAP